MFFSHVKNILNADVNIKHNNYKCLRHEFIAFVLPKQADKSDLSHFNLNTK